MPRFDRCFTTIPLALSVILGIATFPHRSEAHEFWIVPQSFAPSAGERVGLRLFVGDGLVRGEPFARDPRHMARFFAAGSAAAEVTGIPGGDPAGWVHVTGEGAVAVGYASRPSRVELSGPRFDRYLAREGLEAILELRRRDPEPAAPVRELFSRCAKALLRVGPRGAEPAPGRPLGLALELVPDADPTLEQALPIRLLWQGQPLGGVQISVYHEGSAGRRAVPRTDAEGRVRIVVDRSGVWMLSAIQMRRAVRDEAADWYSTWSSLTFEIPRRTARLHHP